VAGLLTLGIGVAWQARVIATSDTPRLQAVETAGVALPALLVPVKSSAAVWIAFVLSIFPILRDWDERLWPNEAQLANRMETRIESAQIHSLSLSLRSPEVHPACPARRTSDPPEEQSEACGSSCRKRPCTG